jgi:hypothetical protein
LTLEGGAMLPVVDRGVPPDTYLIGRDDANSWSFNATSDNVTLIGGSILRDWS